MSEPEPILEEAAYVEVDGVLQAAANLPIEPRLQILGEFLRDPHMQYSTVRVLRDREDLVSDRHLLELAAADSADVRLGALYALIARAPRAHAELPDILLSSLNDPEPSIRRYAARILSQFTEGLDPQYLDRTLRETDPETQAYLIRAMSPSRYHRELTRSLISLSNSQHTSVSTASVSKLIQLGTSSYKVIQELLDSARAGNAAALEPAAWIGDHRAIADLEKLHLEAPPGALRRASFIALEQMDAPYPARRRLESPTLAQPPAIDGSIDDEEWNGAASLEPFAEDWGTDGSAPRLSARIASDEDYIYLAIRADHQRAVRPRISAWRPDSDAIDERLEIAISPSSESGAPFILSVDPVGIFNDRRGNDSSWEPEWMAASQRTPGAWSIESRIPLRSIVGDRPTGRTLLRFNLALVEPGAASRRWTWSVTYGDPYNPERFGDLVLLAEPGSSRR
jgi:hypothetical protein